MSGQPERRWTYSTKEVSADYDENQDEPLADPTEDEEEVLYDSDESVVYGGNPEDSLPELIDLRTETSKAFLDEEAMEEVWVISTGAVHYRDENGALEEISNRLIPPEMSLMSLGGEDNYLYRNEANAYTSKFFGMGNRYQMGLSYEEYSVRIGMRDAEPQDIVVGSSPENPVLANLLQPESSIVYEDVLEDIDLIYQTSSNSVKEYIVLNQPTEQNEFFFHLETEGVLPVNTEEGAALDKGHYITVGGFAFPD